MNSIITTEVRFVALHGEKGKSRLFAMTPCDKCTFEYSYNSSRSVRSDLLQENAGLWETLLLKYTSGGFALIPEAED